MLGAPYKIQLILGDKNYQLEKHFFFAKLLPLQIEILGGENELR